MKNITYCPFIIKDTGGVQCTELCELYENEKEVCTFVRLARDQAKIAAELRSLRNNVDLLAKGSGALTDPGKMIQEANLDKMSQEEKAELIGREVAGVALKLSNDH